MKLRNFLSGVLFRANKKALPDDVTRNCNFGVLIQEFPCSSLAVFSCLYFIIFLPFLAFTQDTEAPVVKNGFNITNALVPPEKILSGGPPRDGIPSIDQPKFVKASEADFLSDNDKVLGVTIKGEAKAYPIKILNWHEIVNDRIGGQAVVITYCPLCGSGMAFSAEVGGAPKTFGVSGLLYNSDVLLYDRETETLWSQIMGQAVAGKHRGKSLTLIPTDNTTWAQWKETHPKTQVLAENTGFTRDYDTSPYANYDKDPSVWFPVTAKNKDYHAKTLVIGIEVDGKFKAYPFPELKKTKQTVIEDKFNGKQLKVHFDKKAVSAYITNAEGKKLSGTTLYWFAWYAFHPETEVFDGRQGQ